MGIKQQGPPKRFMKNFVFSQLGWGIFYKSSHINQHTNKPKVGYSLKSATKAAEAMERKTGKHFSIYKCLHCDDYHIGKNRNNK